MTTATIIDLPIREPALAPSELHVRLCELNHARMEPGEPSDDWQAELEHTHALTLIEGRFLEAERRAVAERAAEAPQDPQAFAAWFDALCDDGPGQHDVLFDYLAEHATLDELRWFITQEIATEAGFEDLVALTQLRMPTRAKLELASNFWDEMGRGKARAMHGPMLAALAKAIDVGPVSPDEVVWESLALGNLLVGLAYNRRYAFHSLGALGVIELTAPSRAVKLVRALERLGVDDVAARYFRLHAVVDIRHAQTWRDEVLVPLLEARPELAQSLAEGALLRLAAGARTFARYRRELGLDTSRPHAL
jgi:hypothetical protein